MVNFFEMNLSESGGRNLQFFREMSGNSQQNSIDLPQISVKFRGKSTRNRRNSYEFDRIFFEILPKMRKRESTVDLPLLRLAGGTGGAISACCSNPFDVLKTRIQAGYKGGMASCARDFVAERGLVALATSGLSARVPQIFVSQAIQFAIVTRIQERFGS